MPLNHSLPRARWQVMKSKGTKYVALPRNSGAIASFVKIPTNKVHPHCPRDIDVQIVDAASRIGNPSGPKSVSWKDRKIEPLKSMQNKTGEVMLAIRLYVCALTAAFLVLVTMDRGVGFLEGVVITCALVYMILDVRADLKMLQADLRQLEHLEQQLAVLLSD